MFKVASIKSEDRPGSGDLLPSIKPFQPGADDSAQAFRPGWPGSILPVSGNPFFETFCEGKSLETILSSLYSWLGEQIPISRIFCYTVEKQSMTMFPMADVSSYPSLLNRQADVRGVLPREALEAPVPEGGARVTLFRSDDIRSSLFLGLINQEHNSALNILLHQPEEFAQYICFFSDEPQAFNLQHAHTLAQLVPPLRSALLRRYYDFTLRSGQSIAPKTDPLEMLEMCEGLNPLLRRIQAVAPTDRPVVILGETGVGKEISAEVLYRLSSRSDAPMVRINCGAISESLIDSELFGHERGAFTGAVSARPGYFEQADGGTIFLDEVGELPPSAQVRLLRVLDQGEIRRVGGVRPIRLNLRVIAATNRDLREEVRAGRFREDLWYRLCVYPLRIPPLRERPEDILTLIKYFIASKAPAMGLDSVPRLNVKELHILSRYDWPGNVRQLEHAIEHALLEYKLADGAEGLKVELDGLDEVPEQSAPPLPLVAPEPLLNFDDAIRKHITRVLAHTRGRISGPRGAAAILGLPTSTLRAKIHKLGITAKSYKSSKG